MNRGFASIFHATPSVHGGVVRDPEYWYTGLRLTNLWSLLKSRGPVGPSVPGTDAVSMCLKISVNKPHPASAISMGIPKTEMD